MDVDDEAAEQQEAAHEDGTGERPELAAEAIQRALVEGGGGSAVDDGAGVSAPLPTVVTQSRSSASASADALDPGDAYAATDAAALVPASLDPAALRTELDALMLAMQSTPHGVRALDLAASAWSVLSSIVADSSVRLCEGLRLILEPTLAARLGGEFRSGKRINMRRVIPYIASNFRKDKLWMRRSTPSKRTYQVMIAVDDSSSMAPGNTGAGGLACEAVALLAKALSRLEVGDIAIASFGDRVRLLHPFDVPFTDEAGARALSQFTFAQASTQTSSTLDTLVKVMEHARSSSGGAAAAGVGVGGRSTTMQLVFIVSDGMMGSGPERERIRNAITEATGRGQLVVLVIVDRAAKSASDESIVKMQSIRFDGGRVVKSNYLDDFPFPYYIVVSDIQSLPEYLSDSLRQWFEAVSRDASTE